MLDTTICSRWLLGAAILMISPLVPAAGDWPGLPPDCWKASRVVHGRDDYESLWSANVSVHRVKKRPMDLAIRSHNNGYAFTARKSATGIRIRIESEKQHQTLIRIEHAFLGGELHWVNEKLIAGRAWWGQIAMTDFIFDVEAGKFVWHESATDGDIAMSQYRASCPQSGDCTCVQAQPAD